MTGQTLDLKNLKIEAETLEAVDLLAQWQSLSRDQMIQQLLREGARQARIEYVARLYGRGDVTLQRAAEMAAVTIYDVMGREVRALLHEPQRAGVRTATWNGRTSISTR